MKIKKEYGLKILINIIILLPLFLMPTKIGHDMGFHLANIDVLADNLSWDSLFNGFIIRPDIANNLGYGIGIFYPMLPHLLGAISYRLLSIIGFDIVASINILYFGISLISSFLIYNLALKLHYDKKVAFVSCVIYLIMPYFIGNMFVRFALNEVFFFMFFLILLNGLFYFKENKMKKYYLFFIIGYTGMIFSHLVLSLYTSIFFILFALINFKKIRDNIKSLLIGIGMVTILVLPNILLLLPHQLSNNYVFNQPGMMTSLGLVTSETLGLNDLVKSNSNYSWDVPLYIPILVIIFFVISFIYLIIQRKKIGNRNILYIIITFFISILMISKLFPWNILPDILLMIQFPWRLMGVLNITIALIAPIFLLQFKDKKYFNIIIIGITISLIAINMPFMDKLYNRIYNYNGYDINEAMGHQNEYLPYPLLDDWVNRENNIIINNGESEILENNINFSFKVRNVNNHTNVELPKLYYKGYILKCDQNHYHKIINKNGYIGASIKHDGEYRLIYTGTIPYILARILRLLFIISFMIYLIRNKLK